MILEIIINIIIKIIKKIKTKKLKIKNNKIEIKKGKYISIMSNCMSCHTINGGKPFCGGLSIKTDFGIINTPNITSNKRYGIGKLKLKQFLKIIRMGISKNGNFLFPVFPYLSYNKIKKKEIKNLFFYLKSLKNENIINKNNFLKFPIKYKKIMIGWRIMFFKKINKKKKIKSNIKRGAYIAESLAHCSMCHTKINKIGKNNKNFKYKGGSLIEEWKSTEILNTNKGLKKTKNKELYKILKEGGSNNKIINSIMTNIINNSLQYINKNDIFCITRYIKNKINDKKILETKKKKNKKIEYKKGKVKYKKECRICHGKLNLGNYPNYPKIIKKNKNNFNNKKNLKNIIKKIMIINTIKNKYPSFMCSTIKKIKNLKIYININKILKK